MALNLQRDAKVYLSTVDTGFSNTNTWEIGVLEGFSFSQATGTQEITANTAGATPTRGQRVFNTSLDPLEWSMSTYVRPYFQEGVATAGYQIITYDNNNPLISSDNAGLSATAYDFNINVDGGGVQGVTITAATTDTIADVLVKVNAEANMSGATVQLQNGDLKFTSGTTGTSSTIAVTAGTTDLLGALQAGYVIETAVGGQAVGPAGKVATAVEKILWDGFTNNSTYEEAATFDVDFKNSNVHELTKFYMFVDFGTTQFKINEAVVNTCEIDFSIDGIGMLAWSGQGSTYQVQETGDADFVFPGTGEYKKTLTQTANTFLKSKLSTITITGGPANSTYTLSLTGGSITLDNGVTFLTPEELGVVNKPIGHFTGTRAVSGTVTCYLDTATAKSYQLLQDMLDPNSLDDTTNEFHVIMSLGNASGSDASPAVPRVEFEIPRAQLSLPTVNVEDIVSVSIEFTGIGTDLNSTDEIFISYFPDPTASEPAA